MEDLQLWQEKNSVFAAEEGTIEEEPKDDTLKTGAKSIVVFVVIIALIGLVVIKKEEYKK